jgi:hypothetical protein
VFDIAQTDEDPIDELEAARPQLFEGQALEGCGPRWSRRPETRASR